ncbi:MAG TPA: NUDIX domain-containing protein [Bacteroidales bacterium]|nr:NUDIX domain-containing protein [Bacteroidales bacterium]
MAQNYKVYINNKEIIFTDDEITSIDADNDDDNLKIYDNPSVNDVKKIISDFVLNEKPQTLFLASPDSKNLFREFRNDYKLVKAAGGLVRDKDNRILCIFRRGKWDLPKGKIDRDERRKHAALREVREETGLDTLFIVRKFDKTYHVYTEKNAHILKKTYWYEMAAVRSEPLKPQAEEDITDIRWFEPDELDEVFENTYTLVRRLLEGIK